jgi:hypothetical protein
MRFALIVGVSAIRAAASAANWPTSASLPVAGSRIESGAKLRPT